MNQTANETRTRLDVSFGGVFSTEKGYTNPTGEQMDGDLTRRTSRERITEGHFYLSGQEDGLDFNVRTPLHSENKATIDEAIIVEAIFKTEAAQQELNTIISTGGSIYVRYVSATEIEYGFDVQHDGQWTAVKQKTAAPEINQENTIAIVYEPTEKGAILHAYLNGVELHTASSEVGRAACASGVEHTISFGNDGHTAALNRGFTGSFSRIHVTSFEGDFHPNLLTLTKLLTTDKKLSVLGLGKLEGNVYVPADDEKIEGDLVVEGGEVAGLGMIKLVDQSATIKFTPLTPIVENGQLLGDSYVEMILSETAIRENTVFLNIADAVKLQKSVEGEGEALDLLVGHQVKNTVAIPTTTAEDVIHLSVVYRNIGEAEAEISLFHGTEQLVNIVTERPTATGNAIVYINQPAEVFGLAFTTITGEFTSDLLSLRGGPCIIPTDLAPAYQISIKKNECAAALATKASFVRPRPKQVTWQAYEQTAFIHYGINTYYQVEWGDLWKHDDPTMFNPTDLDTDQWARALRDSGFKMAVLTAKHHDGFTLYPSRYTEFGVKNSPWKDGKGDVVREFVTSMHKYGIKVGIYLSPSDHGAFRDGVFANGSARTLRTIPTLVDGDDRIGNTTLPTFNLPATDYGEMLLNQLYEVLTEYGEVDEVWFDGAQGNIPGNTAEKYDWDSFYTLIEQLVPEAVIAVVGDDVRWVGNESGWARENEWSILGATRLADGQQAYHPSFSSPDLGSQSALVDAAANGMDYLTWWPAEVDVSIRDGWFYHDHQQPKSIADLRNIYYQSVARNSVLLLNIPPNREGKFAEADVQRLKEWHKSIQNDFTINHVKDAKIEAENGAIGENPAVVIDGQYESSWQASSTGPSSITFTFEEAVKVERVILQENIHFGQQVESFTIEVRNDAGEWLVVYANESIGYKRIATLPEPVLAKQFRVQILKSRGIVHLSTIGLYEASADA